MILGSKEPHQVSNVSPSAENKPSSKLENTSLRAQAFLVAMRLWETPVPIPNTMVKPQTADGTALETVWESRWPPNLKRNKDVVSDKETSEI